MNFQDFKNKYLKVPVEEFPNNRAGKTPLVTVKVVTYNHVNFIRECLDSILMQKTNFDFEILIAEDDSNDGTREICKEYAKKHPDRIRLLLNSRKNNIKIDDRPSGTFNNTYANYLIDSKYIAFIEGDDYWSDENSLQKRFEFLEKNEDHVMCFHNAKIYFQNSNKFHDRYLAPFNKSTTLESEKILNTQIPPLTLLYRNGLVEIFDENMLKIVSGDVILRGKLSKFGKARYIHEIKPGVYRVHDGGIFSGGSLADNKNSSLEAGFYLLELFERNKWDVRHVNASIANTFFYLFIERFRKEKKIKINYIWKCITYSRKSNISFFGICKNILNSRKTRKI